jgi:hypothetical protein
MAEPNIVSMKIKKTLRILLVIIGITTITGFALKGINYLVYKGSISKKYSQAHWQGNWHSDEYRLISGQLVANLPPALPLNETIEADILLYYNIWSIYNLGGTREFKLIGFLGDEGTTDGKGSNSYPDTHVSFKAKGRGTSGQVIEYNGVVNINRSKIIGGYKSYNPIDVGSFVLRKL